MPDKTPGETNVKFCVYGAGAIGGYLAVGLAEAGHDVVVIARGAHLAAIRERGLVLRAGGRARCVRVAASDDPADFGPQDFVLCALKAHQAAANAGRFAPLLGPETPVVTAMNGIPWWYFHRSGGAFEGRRLESVDPDGAQWRLIGPERAIGCVVDPACAVVEPGVIEHREFNRFTIGEPSRGRTQRIEALARALGQAGFEAPIRDEIRWNVWLKLWGNVCFNPLSALTLATLDRLTGEPALRALCRTMMLEARAVSLALGIEIPETMIERRLDAAGRAAGHKMSMLQDLERGHPLEIDALAGAVQELGRLTATPTPTIDLVLALVRERARMAGAHHEG